MTVKSQVNRIETTKFFSDRRIITEEDIKWGKKQERYIKEAKEERIKKLNKKFWKR